MDNQYFKINCDFLFSPEIQNIIYSVGPMGIIVALHARALLKKAGGKLSKNNYDKIAFDCRTDIDFVRNVIENYGLFHFNDEYFDIAALFSENELKCLPYLDFLQTPYWKEVANKVKTEASFRCKQCGSSKDLEVHHLTYEHHGDEANHLEDLVCLCHECHSKLHKDK